MSNASNEKIQMRKKKERLISSSNEDNIYEIDGVDSDEIEEVEMTCDAPNPGCLLTTRQPAEFYVSHVMRHVHV